MLSQKKSFVVITGLLVTSHCLAVEPPLLVQPESMNRMQPESAPNVSLDEMQGEVEVQSSDIIQSIHFAGGTSVPLELLALDVQVLLNQPYSADGVGKTLEKLTVRFHTAGYPLAFATVKQDGFHDGRLTITIVEGYVVRSELEIPDDAVKQEVRAILQPVMDENPATQASLERAILLINRIPGYQFDIALPRPKTISGATSIRVIARDNTVFEPFVGYSMQQDSDRNFSLGARINVNRLSINRVTLIGLIPRDNNSDEQYYSVRLEHDIANHGMTGQLSGSFYTESEATAIDVEDVDVAVENKLKRRSLDYSIYYPIILSRATELSLSLGLTYENEERNYDLFFDGIALGELNDKLDYVLSRLSIDVVKRLEKLNFSLGFGINQSIGSAFKYRSDLESEDIYNDDFIFYDLQFSSSYEVVEDYVLSLRANGMYADERIVPSQRMNFGGLNYGRGYPESTLEGDQGYGAEVKILQRNQHGQYFFNPYITYDYAYAEQASVTTRSDRISSAALGVEVGYGANLYVAVDYAKPLKERQNSDDYVYNLSVSWRL
ncbi:POTRA domain-containing protein [Vibrio sp. CDRSL-10 TSBA]